MSKNPFIGRQKELDRAVKDLGWGTMSNQDSIRLIYVKGEEGIGKKAFLNEFWRKLSATQRSCLLIWPRNLHLSTNPDEFTECFIGSASTNGSENSECIKKFDKALNTHSARYRESAETMQGFMLHNTRSEGGASDTRMDKLAPLWEELIGLHLLQYKLGREIPNIPWARIFLALDGYESYSEDHKKWLTRLLLNPLAAAGSDYDIRFLVAGEHTLGSATAQLGNWIPSSEQIREIELPLLSVGEINELLLKCDMPVKFSQRVFDKSLGHPGRSVEEIKAINAELAESKQNEWLKSLLAGKSDKQKSWIFGASYLSVCNVEAIAIFCSHQESTEVYQWLVNSSGLKIVRAGSVERLDKAEIKTLRLWLERNDPFKFERDRKRVERFEAITKKIPSYEDRMRFLILSDFKYFNSEMLRDIYKDQADQLLEMIDSKPQRFIKTDNNYQIASDYRHAINDYRNLVSYKSPAGINDKIKACWRKKRDVVNDKIKKIESDIKEKELALNLVAQVTNTEPTLATTAAAAQEERGQGLVSAGSQRKLLIAEVRQLSQKIQSIDKRLASGLNVKVTSMPKAAKDKN